MINITDINKRLTDNPEPIEVTRMREHILSSFSNLEFIEEGHIYNIHNADGTITENIPSASAIIKRFENETDWDDISYQYAVRHNIAVNKVRRTWRENNLKATNNGTQIHFYNEQLHNLIMFGEKYQLPEQIKPQYEDGYLIPLGPKEEAGMKFWEEMMSINNMYPLIAECKMYMPLNNKYGINEIFCGTADTLFAYKSNNEWGIIQTDYKNNNSLINDFNRNNGVMMQPPFNELVDEALTHYMIQQGLYSMMLENIGYKVFGRRLIWLKDNGTYEKVKLPYIKEQLINSFNMDVSS